MFIGCRCSLWFQENKTYLKIETPGCENNNEKKLRKTNSLKQKYFIYLFLTSKIAILLVRTFLGERDLPKLGAGQGYFACCGLFFFHFLLSTTFILLIVFYILNEQNSILSKNNWGSMAVWQATIQRGTFPSPSGTTANVRWPGWRRDKWKKAPICVPFQFAGWRCCISWRY